MLKATIKGIFLPILLALAVFACAPMTPEPYTLEEIRNDSAITKDVQAALGWYTQKVTVETKKGVVYLKGNLVDRSEVDSVMRIVSSVPGVRFIHDDFEVQWNYRDSFLQPWRW